MGLQAGVLITAWHASPYVLQWTTTEKRQVIGCGETSMSQQMLRDATARFFDDFVAAFQSFNGDQIAALYVVPTISLQADGRLACLLSLADVGSYFQAVVDSYHAEGCRSCQYKDLEVVPMGGRSVLGTVTWELLCNDGSVLKTWRESYNLMLLESGLRVFASTDHVG